MFWWRLKRDKPFKATPKYHVLSNMFETFSARIEIGYGPTCDVSCICRNIQDGGQPNISNQN